MNLKVTTWQRMALRQAVGELRGDVALMRKALKAMEALDLDSQEADRVGLMRTPDGLLAWEREVDFELEVKDREAADLIRRVVREKNDWPVARAAEVVDLAEQVLGKERHDG